MKLTRKEIVDVLNFAADKQDWSQVHHVSKILQEMDQKNQTEIEV